MKVSELCERHVVTVEPETPVTEAARRMVALGVGSLVVLQHGRICGIITDRDIVARGVRQERDVRQLAVSDLMTPNPITIEPDADLPRATALMADKGVRRLPVADEAGRLVGVLALDDVVILLGDEMANLRAAVAAALSR